MPEPITTIQAMKAAAEAALSPLNEFFVEKDIHVMEPDPEQPMTPAGFQKKKRVLESSSALRAGMVGISSYSEFRLPGSTGHELSEIVLEPAGGEAFRVVGITQATIGGLWPDPDARPVRGGMLTAPDIIAEITAHLGRWKARWGA